MAVLIEAISVVIRRETVVEKYPGGVDQYIQDCPNGSLCMDEDIVQVGFMLTVDALDFIGSLERLGFRFISDDEFDEIAIVDQLDGITYPCDWLEYLKVVVFEGDVRVSVCQINGSDFSGVAFPCSWNYETSLSKHSIVMDGEDIDNRMVFLRHENGLECYLDPLTGREMFIERTIRRNCNA
jgi:hypothetical protein